MRIGRPIVAPAVLLAVAVVTGGWFLQRGVEQEENVYFQVRLFREVVDHISDYYVDDLEQKDIYGSAIEGIIRELDPNTSFIAPREYEDFRIRTQGGYGGVGLEIIERDGWITVMSPIPGSPAARAGIRAGDQFVQIDGRDAEGWSIDQAAEALRGEPESEVPVAVRRPGVDGPIPFTLARAAIQLRAVPFSLMLEDGIGYVPLQLFRESSSQEVRAAMDSLRVIGGLRALILDIRGNPGGLLEEGVGVSDLFLPPGAAVVETRGRARGQNESLRASGPEIADGLPLVVLIDGASASASEIVAGALQDHDRALVLGMPSFGKGSVQTLFTLTGGNALRLTTARWYTPVGRSIEKVRAAPSGDESPQRLSLEGRPLDTNEAEERPSFQSMGGRTISGGGGIIPDVVVSRDTLAEVEQQALQGLFRRAGTLNTALFDYAVRFVQDNPALEPGFELREEALERFYVDLLEAGVTAELEDVRPAERYFRYHLEREIALQAWGEEAQFLQVKDRDRQLSTAVQILTGVSTPAEVLGATIVSSQTPVPDPATEGGERPRG